MRMTHARTAVTTFAIGAFVTGAALFGTGIANADLLDDAQPLLTSTCSFDQIEAALHDIAPESAQRLDGNPATKAMLQMTLAQSPDLRQRAFQQLETRKQLLGGLLELGMTRPEVGTVLREAATACHRYPGGDTAAAER
ncbi:hemophore-related protein [Nocardia sp. NPDC003482]|uniref:hemophore-related protein n=1 Tax=Nocardia sp. NPDC004068 TaxID=3364303 RepID=UPI003694648B